MARMSNDIKPGARPKGSRLTVIEYVGNDKFNHKMWRCKCDCGNEIITETHRLVTGKTRSCGCLKQEGNNRRHGKCYSRLNRIYRKMKQRCFNINNPRYSDYGGRGITVCEEWLGENGFENFYEWSMNNGYQDDLSIDRLDNDGNYEPDNCRWTTVKEQVRNTRRNIFITANGETHTLAEWSEITGIRYTKLLARIRKLKWEPERALELEAKNE